MHTGKLVFAQLMDHLPLHTFRRCVAKYPGRYPVLTFSHLDQFLCMAFAQLTYRESLRDIETCLRAHSAKLYHLGIRGGIARSTLADANENRDWRIYQDFALSLIQTTRKLYAEDGFGLELTHTVYALDSTTIDLCLALFPWARFRKHKGAVKLHTLLKASAMKTIANLGKQEKFTAIFSNSATLYVDPSCGSCGIIDITDNVIKAMSTTF